MLCFAEFYHFAGGVGHAFTFFVVYLSHQDQMGTVGIPTPITEMRLESVPEMNYDALGDEPKGEILLKGDNNFQGYYKNEKGTSEVLESDGWFHTGQLLAIHS